MKKSIIRTIFNFISIVMLLWTIISGAYLALPQEYKDLIPQFNWLTALISGGSTGILGSTMLIVDIFLKKNKSEVDTKYFDLAKQFITINEKYQALENKVEKATTETRKNNELISENNRLLKIDLESKLSNPLVEEFIKEKIRGEVSGQKS